jgi:beta-glucosidase/6-phospho-beta-glucosidase/beta-galactosidase
MAFFSRCCQNFISFLGVMPYENLYHNDLPQGLETAYGGLLNSKVV